MALWWLPLYDYGRRFRIDLSFLSLTKVGVAVQERQGLRAHLWFSVAE